MAQKRYDAFDHASHNLKAHNFIKESQEFPDWEITTAFYCSLKFFEGALFPSEYLKPGSEDKNELKEFKSYNEYQQIFKRFCQGTPHDAMKRFVRYNTDQKIWSCYKDLYDLSHNSRYKNYQVEPEELDIVRKSLENIREYCTLNMC
jgi:hypothetical protein